MKKNWIFLIIGAIILFNLVALIFRFLDGEDKPEVVVVLKTANVQYWNILKSGAEQAFDDFNIHGRIIVPESESKVSEQLALLKNILKQKPNALVVALIQPDDAIPVLMEYKKENIPVLLVDTEAKWNDQTSYIGTDNFNLGIKSGALLAAMLQPDNQVAMIYPTIVNPDVLARLDGAREALENAGVNVVAVRQADNENGEVKIAVEGILQKFPNISGVFTTTDMLAVKTIKELKAKGLSIPVIGTDGTMEVVREIEKGKQSATIAQNPYDMGYVSVVQAVNAIKGESVKKRVDSGIDIITQDNAKDKIDFLKTILK